MNFEKRIYLLPSLLALLCFINTVGHGFVYDDIYHIVQAESVLGDWSAANLKAALTTDSWTFLTGKSSGKINSIYYRPVLSLYWMLTYAYSGVVAWRWHLTSVLLHALTAALVYQTVLLSLRHTQSDEQTSRLLALIAATVFAVHPTQSESVAWVAAAANSLTAIPILLSLMAYLKARQGSTLWLAVSAVFYALALFTKEFAVILPLLLLAYELFLLDRLPSLAVWIRRAAARSIPFVIVTLGYVLLRVLVLKIQFKAGGLGVDFPEMSGVSRLVQLYTLPTVILTYLKNILLPFSLKPFYPVYHIYKPELLNFYLPLLAILFLGTISILIARRSHTFRLALIWLIIPLLPVLEIRAMKIEFLVFDRYLYLVLVGAGLILGNTVVWLNKRLGGVSNLRGSLWLVLAFIVAVCVASTIKQNTIWADEWSYWGAAQEGNPTGCIPNKELGRLNVQVELFGQAIEYFEKAKLSCPNSPSVIFQLGTLYIKVGSLDKAEQEFKKLVNQSDTTTSAAAYYNLAFICQKMGDKAQAANFYNRAIEVDPSSSIAAQAKAKLLELEF